METVDEVVLSGPPGVGKSSLAEEMFDQLCDRGVRHAVIDVDALCLSYPFRAGDPCNNVMSWRRNSWQDSTDDCEDVTPSDSCHQCGRVTSVRVTDSRR
jgi:Methylmalonyl Co-A mutase-associated GTPase MeaB